jgi:hypothetical protein
MSQTPQVNGTPTLEKLEMIADCISGDLDRWNLNNAQEFYVLDLVRSYKVAQEIIQNKEKHPKIVVQKAQQKIK